VTTHDCGFCRHGFHAGHGSITFIYPSLEARDRGDPPRLGWICNRCIRRGWKPLRT
jgi:hypothetical protein